MQKVVVRRCLPGLDCTKRGTRACENDARKMTPSAQSSARGCSATLWGGSLSAGSTLPLRPWAPKAPSPIPSEPMAATTAGETIMQRRRWANVRLAAAAAARRRRRARLSDPSHPAKSKDFWQATVKKVRLSPGQFCVGRWPIALSPPASASHPRVSCDSQNGSQG